MFRPDQTDCTVLLLTFNRPDMAARQLRFLARHHADFPIHVLDVSNPEIQDDIARTIEPLPLNVTHRRLPTAARHGDTVRAGLTGVDTPYALLLPDDDVLVPGGFAAALEFLRGNPDYIAAQGFYVGFSETGSEFRLTDVQDWCPSIDAERPTQRLAAYMARYQPMVYGVYRADALRRSFAAPLELQNVMLLELMQAFLAIHEGKLKRLRTIYTLRRNDGSLRARRSLNIFWQFMESPERLMADYAVYRRMLVDVFAAGPDGPIGREGLSRYIDLIHGEFVYRHVEPGALRFLLPKELGMLTPEQVAVGEAMLEQPAKPPAEPVIDVDAITATNTPRRYRFEPGVLTHFPAPEAVLNLDEVMQTVRDLAVYE